MRKSDHQLVQNVLDGNVTREEFDAFQNRLRNDPQLADLYKGYALLHHTLHEEFEGVPTGEPVNTGSGFRPTRRGVLLFVLILACAIVSALFLTKPWSRTSDIDNAALVTFSLDAVWLTEGPNHRVGSATGLPAGTGIRLLQGRACIHLTPSITAHLEGPAEATVVSQNKLHLASGALFLDTGESTETVEISTPQCGLTSQGAHYGILTGPEESTELHVVRGSVNIDTTTPGSILSAGNAIRITGKSPAISIPLREDRFPKTLGRFLSLPITVFDRRAWRIEYGNPTFSLDRIEGVNYSIYQDLPPPPPAGGVLLATLEAGKPVSGNFHTDGWAGVSLYQDGREQVFFGDPFGTSATWALDVKNRAPVIPSNPPVSGPKTITLRYHYRTGEVSLHEGGIPLKPPFSVAKIQPNLRFDQIRVASSTGAALTVNALSLRVGGE